MKSVENNTRCSRVTARCMLWACLVVLFHPVSGHTTADGPDYWQVKGGAAVTLRAEPKETSSRVATIPAGTKGLKNLGCQGVPSFAEWSRMTPEQQKASKDNHWCQTTFQGQTGWVPNKFLQEGAAAPSFDCGKATSTVEKLICNDAELAQLDNEQASVYRQALSAAGKLGASPDAAVNKLKTMERGWIKGRDECWKTANVKSCVRNQYQRNTSTLQAQWSLVKGSKVRNFKCPDRSEFYLVAYATPHLPTVAVEYGDTREIFIGATGKNTYVGSFGKSLALKEKEALLRWDQSKPALTCTSDGP